MNSDEITTELKQLMEMTKPGYTFPQANVLILV